MSVSPDAPGEVIALLTDAEPPAGGRRIETLVKTSAFELKRLSLAKGAEIHTHQAAGPITVQCLAGRITFTEGETVHDLPAGCLIHLAPRRPHSLLAEEDSVVLVTKIAAG